VVDEVLAASGGAGRPFVIVLIQVSMINAFQSI